MRGFSVKDKGREQCLGIFPALFPWFAVLPLLALLPSCPGGFCSLTNAPRVVTLQNSPLKSVSENALPAKLWLCHEQFLWDFLCPGASPALWRSCAQPRFYPHPRGLFSFMIWWFLGTNPTEELEWAELLQCLGIPKGSREHEAGPTGLSRCDFQSCLHHPQGHSTPSSI